MNIERKFLPIGSVCKYGNENVMIIGYFHDNNFNVERKYEYIVCDYPNGITGNNYKFINHYEIEALVQIGYKDEKFEELNTKLLSLKNKTHYIFDSNGIVTAEINENDIVKNPFVNKEENKETVENISKTSSEWPIFSNITFDENGFVVSAEENNKFKEDVEEDPVKAETSIKFDENGFVIEDKEAPAKAESSIKFDENGFVIDDGVSPVKVESNIKFDENGFVIEDGEETPVKVESSIKFDENGFVIEDGEETPVKVESSIKFDENGFVIEDGEETPVKAESSIKFDENGFVIEDGTAPAKAESSIKFDENGFVIDDGVSPVKAESNIKFDENGFVVED